jgi:diguanylate cyclase (GGDEF)-like protein/PAS domain S-box-containing protein
MRMVPLRRLVSAIGTAAALVTASAIPTGYALVGYFYESNLLSFKAELNANRLAKYIYSHETLWQYQRVRLAEIIELPEEHIQQLRQRVFDAKEKLVLDTGEAPGKFHLLRSAPIIVAGETVGRLESQISLDPFVRRLAFVTLFSFALGAGVSFALRTLPLRVLDRTIGDLQAANRTISDKNVELEESNKTLQQREVELRLQNERFDAAIANIPQGLAMFDAHERLVVCNRRYAEIYGFSPDLIKPGVTQREVLEHQITRGTYAGVDPRGYLQERVEIARALRPSDTVLELNDGRYVAVTHRPMPRGGWVSTHEDITERKRSEEQIAHMARHDVLTDLPNRAFLREEMDGALKRIRRCGESLALLYLDLDRFKIVNDTLGHAAGDALLKVVGQRLLGCARTTDTVARIGGDEFAVLQVAVGEPREVSAFAERVIEELCKPYALEGQQVVIGVSIGITFAPADAADPDSLLRNADLALYRAKTEGKGRCCFFEAAMKAQMQARRALERDLRDAFRNGEFELFYQPLVSSADGEISGLEALIRWNHPQRGVVLPNEFIEIAEDIGLIGPLGEWVIRQACREAAQWPGEIPVAVNLSSDQFNKGSNVVQVVMNALASSGLAPHRLELEITESLLLKENENTLNKLGQLRALGVRIALDDFGTGYSSLSYLRAFPFDKIKIDQSFVREMVSREDCSAIVRAVTGLAKTLGMTTVAEGVETQEQLECIRAEGCTQAQGYLFSEPKPFREIAHLVEKTRKVA